MSKFSDEVEQEIIARYISGESTVVLGMAYGTSKTAINRVLARYKVQRRKPGERPLRSDAKLYQSDPETLRKMVEDGMSLREIGRTLGMVSSAVHNACVAFGIERKDRIEQIAAKNCRQIPDSLFSLPLNAKESWLLGLLMTDGCVSGGDRIKLGITDKDGVQLASQIIGFGSIKEALPTTSEYNGIKIQGKLSIWNYVACSTQLVERLGLLGLTPRKTKTLAFPNVLDLSLPDFIRGLWDGDGYWHINKYNALISGFGSASESFMHSLHSITSNITGSPGQVRSNRRKDFWRISHYKRPSIALAKWLYYESGLACLQRKYTIVQPFL